MNLTAPIQADSQPSRRRLPDERHGITHKFCVAGHEGYLIVELYENGQPGEIFIKGTFKERLAGRPWRQLRLVR